MSPSYITASSGSGVSTQADKDWEAMKQPATLAGPGYYGPHNPTPKGNRK